MIKEIKMFSVVSILLALITQGCVVQPGSQVVGSHPTITYSDQDNKLNQFVFIDTSLNSTVIKKTVFGQEYVDKNIRISLLESGLSRTATDNLEVWGRLKNHSPHPQALETRTEFFDENKRPLNDVSSWQKIYIAGNGDYSFFAKSITSKATLFRVQIREIK